MALPANVWRPTSGNGEAEQINQDDIATLAGDTLVTLSGNNLVILPGRYLKLPPTVWAQDEAQ